MQAAGSVDHPLPQQSDAGEWGRATCGWGRVTDERGYGQNDVAVSGWDLKRAGCGAIRTLADSRG